MANNYTLTQFTNVDITTERVDQINELNTGDGITFGHPIKVNKIQSANPSSDLILMGTGASVVEIQDLLQTNTIDERTPNMGVTCDSLLLKDGMMQYTKNNNVNQTTSLTTSVTSNGVAGQITTVSSTLGPNSNATFTVNNTSCLVTSYVQLQPVSYSGTQGGIAISNSAISNGSFDISIRNTDTLLAQNGAFVIKFFLL